MSVIDHSEVRLLYDYVIVYGNDISYTLKSIERRKSGYVYTMRDHLEALMLSVLSAQRPWVQIQNNIDNLYDIFGGYDPDYMFTQDPRDLEEAVCDISCGNRRIKKQMQEIRHNIHVLREIERVYGDCDYLVRKACESVDSVYTTVYALTDKNSNLKLKGVGEALCLQYMRQLGVDVCKPDVHILRILERLGYFNYEPSAYEAVAKVREIATSVGKTSTELGAALWTFCATGYSEICTAVPHCEKCPVVCNYYGKSITHEQQRIRDLLTWNIYFKTHDKSEALIMIDELGTSDLRSLCKYIRNKENIK